MDFGFSRLRVDLVFSVGLGRCGFIVLGECGFLAGF